MLRPVTYMTITPKPNPALRPDPLARRPSLVGTRHVCQCCARELTIVAEYSDGLSLDNTGYDYVFDGEPGLRWISTYAASIRFAKLGEKS